MGREKDEIFLDRIGIYVYQRPVRICLRISQEGNFRVQQILCLADKEPQGFGKGHFSSHVIHGKTGLL
jgi:hypothetical protein